MATDTEKEDLTVLPIERVTMPSEDVSDLRDVVDAINRLCETMKNSNYEDADEGGSEPELVEPERVVVRRVETFVAETWSDPVGGEASEAEPPATVCEPATASEYYTASSEVSLLSDEMCQAAADDRDRAVEYASSQVSLQSDELGQVAPDERHGVMAGHVAAMRERFESMTRTNTPCPDGARAISPSFDIFRNITPSPDQLDKS